MNKKEIAELKRRLTKKKTSISRMAGWYVDVNKNKLCRFNRTFLTLESDELGKYLEIASKVLSGTLGNNLLNLAFTSAAEAENGPQAQLYALKQCALTDEAALEVWADRFIASYERLGNYLLLLFADAYDVPLKTSDDLELGESEEVYSYILAAVCPVSLSEGGLEYQEAARNFGMRVQDWVVEMPESGFLFPAFNDRSSDIHNALFYTRDPKEAHTELMTEILGCEAEQTAVIQKLSFADTVREVLGTEEETETKLLDLEQNLKDIKEYHEAQLLPEEKDDEDKVLQLSADVLKQAIESTKITDIEAERLTQKVGELFGSKQPSVENVLDKPALKNYELKRSNRELTEQLSKNAGELKEWKETAQAAQAEVKRLQEDALPEGYSVVLKTDSDRAGEIRFANVGGVRCLLVPVEAGESVLVNGEAW